jgi:recombination protein RecT
MATTKGPTTIPGPPAAVSGEIVGPANKQPSRFVQFKQVLDRGMDQIKIALPKHIDPVRFYRVILTAMQAVPKPGQLSILDCTQESVFSCMLTCAQLGLEPNGPQGHAYLIPFRDNSAQVNICTLVIGFKGLIKLARNSGEIAGVAVRVVHEKDQFEYEYGLIDRCWHVPTDEEDPGQVTHAYCVWKFKDGGYHFDVMTKKELDRIKNRKNLPSISPWKSDEEEMQKKTVLRRSSKMVPNSIELAHGIAVNDRQEEGLAPIPMQIGAAAEETSPADVETKQPRAIAEKPETLDDIALKKRLEREAKQAETVPAAGKPADPAAKAAEERAFGGDKPAAAVADKPPADTKPPKIKMATAQQTRDIAYLAADRGVQMSEITERLGVPSTSAMTAAQADEEIAKLRAMPEAGEPGASAAEGE